jgi:hypothetical protein
MMDADDYNPSDRSQSEVANEDEEDLIIPHASYSSDSEGSASAMPTSIKTIWEMKKFEKILDKQGCKMWKCHFVGLSAQHGTTPRLGKMPLVGRMLLVARGFLHIGRLSLRGLPPRKKQRRLHKTLTKETSPFLQRRRMLLPLLCIQTRRIPSLLLEILRRLPMPLI